MPRLIAQSPEFQGQVYDLVEAEITIGRLPENKISIDHGSISGHHAVLSLMGEGAYSIRDLNSTNGTRINGARIVQQKLQRGDTVHIGNIEFAYESEVVGVTQPLPELRAGVELNEVNESVRPDDFANLSPFPKETVAGGSQTVKMVLIGLIVLSIGGTGFLLFKLFTI